MHYRTIAIIVFICLALISAIYIYSEKQRYYLVNTDKGPIYKIDKQTGQTWKIVGNKETRILGESDRGKSKATDEEAIRIVAGSSQLAEDSYDRRTNEEVIKENIQRLKGNLKYSGWRAKQKEQGVFLVSYTITVTDSIDAIEQGYYFEVAPLLGIVRYINKDSLLANKYGLRRDNLMSPRFIVILSTEEFLNRKP